jgi:hypothetical protein
MGCEVLIHDQLVKLVAQMADITCQINDPCCFQSVRR